MRVSVSSKPTYWLDFVNSRGIIHSFEGLLGYLDDWLALKSPAANFGVTRDPTVSSPSHLSDKPTIQTCDSLSKVSE